MEEIAEGVRSLSTLYPNAPQAKITLRLDSIQERGGVSPTVALQPSTASN